MIRKLMAMAIPCLLIGIALKGEMVEVPSIPVSAQTRVLKDIERLPMAKRQLGLLKSDRAALLSGTPLNIVEGKKLTAPSGIRNDYVSLGPYWWPDPSKVDGKPYIRKDGEVNPDSRQYDDKVLGSMCSRVSRMGLLYFLTGDEEIAACAVTQLKIFFLNPETRMNPHLRYGQGIPGRCDGRVTGIIDTLNLIHVADAIGMLSSSPAMTGEILSGLRRWFGDYAEWLSTDPMAREDWGLKQNHGLSYHGQIMNYSRLAGDEGRAREHAKILSGLAVKMVAADGSLPEEIERTRSWHYSLYALEILFYSIGAARGLGVDMLAPENESGRSIRRAVDYLCGFIDNPDAWPYKEIKGVDLSLLTPILMQMYFYTADEAYLKQLEKLPFNHRMRSVNVFFSP